MGGRCTFKEADITTFNSILVNLPKKDMPHRLVSDYLTWKIYWKHRLHVALLGAWTVPVRITVALRTVFLGPAAIPVNQHDLGRRSINRGRDRLKLWWSRGWWRILRDVGHLLPFSLSYKLLPADMLELLEDSTFWQWNCQPIFVCTKYVRAQVSIFAPRGFIFLPLGTF